MAFLDDILKKLKANTLDRTDLDEKIGTAINRFRDNASAWKQTLTNPQTRSYVSDNLIRPKVEPVINTIKTLPQRTSQAVTNYFTPEYRAGDNFWSSKPAKALAAVQSFNQRIGAEEPALKFVKPFAKYGNQALLAAQTAAFVPLQKIGVNYTPSQNLIKKVQDAGMLSQQGTIGGKELWNTGRNTADVMLKVKGLSNPALAAKSMVGGAVMAPVVQTGVNLYEGKPVYEGTGKAVVSGAIGGLGNAGTTSLTNSLVEKFAKYVPFLQPLTDKAISSGLPTGTEPLKQAIKQWVTTAGKRLIKAAVLETVVETPIWAAINQDQKESYLEALQREAVENLVMNVGMAGVNSLIDAKTLSPIVKKSVSDAIQAYKDLPASVKEGGYIDFFGNIKDGTPRTRDWDTAVDVWNNPNATPRGKQEAWDTILNLSRRILGDQEVRRIMGRKTGEYRGANESTSDKLIRVVGEKINSDITANIGYKEPFTLRNLLTGKESQRGGVDLKDRSKPFPQQPRQKKELDETLDTAMPENIKPSASSEVVEAKLPLTQTEKPLLPKRSEAIPTAKTDSSPIFPESAKPGSRLLPETSAPSVRRLDTILSKPSSEKSPSTDIIQQAKGQIGSMPTKAEKPLKQQLRDFYTNWVNRFQPLEDVATRIEKETKSSILPEKNPVYTTRRLLGAGAVAEQRHQKVLQPILDELGDIPSSDFDVFLKAKRDLNLGGRGIKGSDATQAQQVIEALGQKYDTAKMESVAQKLYAYQDEGLKMLQEAGIISPDVYTKIKDTSQNYVPFQRVMDEVDNYLGLPTKKAYVGTQPVQKIKGSERQILSPVESIIANTYKIESAVSRNQVAQSLVNLRQVAPQYADMFEKVGKDGADTIAVWENGKKSFYRVGEDIARSVKGLNEENVGILTKILSAPAQLLRQGATGRNIDFVIPNAFKDQFDAAITSKYGYKPFIDYFRGLAHLVNYKRTGADELVEEWINSGGKIFFENMGGRKQISEQIQQATQTKGLFKQIKDWAIGGIDTLGEFSETPTRLGLYQRAKEATGNSLLAMMESREGTLDFARMGAKMKTANSIIPFLNVRVQGFDKIIRSAKDHPGKMALNMTLYAGLPQLMVSLYNNVFHPEEYANVPQWEKDTNFIVITGTNQDGKPKYLKVPKGNIVPLIANPTDQFVSYLAGTNKQNFGQMALSLLTDVAPVLESGTNLQEVFTKTLGSNLPQAIKPVFENAFNKSTFYTDEQGKPQDIVPYYLENKPPSQQFKKSTPEAYKALGRILNVSPLKAQNFLEGYLSGFIKTPTNITQILKDVSEGKPVDPNKVPVLRRFYGEREDYYTSSTPKKEDSRFAASAAEPNFLQRLFNRGVKEEAVQQLPADDKDLAIIYEEAKKDFDSHKEKRLKIEYGNYEDWEKKSKLEELDREYQFAKSMVERIEREQPEAVLKMNLNLHASSGSKTVEDRAAWAKEALSKATDKESFTTLVDQMLEAKVLTKSVVEALREQGIPIDRYTEGGKIKTLGGSGAKPLKSLASILKTMRQNNEELTKLMRPTQAKRPSALSMVLNQSRQRPKSSPISIETLLARRRQQTRTPIDIIRSSIKS